MPVCLFIDLVPDGTLVGILRINNDIFMISKQVTEVGGAYHGHFPAVGVFARPRREL